MPPRYVCRMCRKQLDDKAPINKDIFYVRDKKGWYGREWECRACYTSREVGAVEDRDGFREKGEKSKKKDVDTEVIGRGYVPSVEE